MIPPLRLATAILCLALAAFCAFGFLATFEPLPAARQWTFRAIYAVAGLASLVQAGRLLTRRDPPPR